MQQHEQTFVHLRLKPNQREIVVIVAEGVLKLRRDEIEGEHAKNGHKGVKTGKDRVGYQRCHHQWCQDHEQEEQYGDELRVWKGKPSIRDLFGIEQVDETPRQCLVHTREDRGRYRQDPFIERPGDKRLEEVQDALHPVEAILLFTLFQVLQGGMVNAKDVQSYKVVRVSNLLKSASMAQAHQPDQGVPKIHHLLGLGCFCTPRKRHQAANRIKPLPTHLVQE
mmetsp:Transcript_13881/g.39700  ORF Transcript_13881/g.39700 Transcript_13881/m.39700 type:complete len:223 (+) Transcript_13881:534-1202(+)